MKIPTVLPRARSATHYLLRNVLHATLLLLLLVQPAQAVKEEQRLTLNFSDTDIKAVIHAVARLTGRNFIIDPRVKGKVTVITHQELTPDEVYQVFLSLLKVHGFAAVAGRTAIKIIPDVNAKQDAIKTVTRARARDGDELITEVIQIQHVNAAQLVPILRPLIPQRGHLAAYPQSNVLIISDSAANVARLTQIIERIDQAVNQELEVITLRHAIASEIVRIIKQLQPTRGKDKSGYTVVADDRTNSILLGGDKQQRLRLRAIITHMDIPLDIAGNTHVIYLRYAKAKDLVPVLTGVSKTIGKGTVGKKAGGGKDIINIQADESANALVINAPAGMVRSLRSVIQQLDIRRAQVLIEAVLAEVSYEKSSELGVQWAADGSNGGTKTGPVGILNFSNFGPGLLGLLEEPPAIGDGFSLGLGRLKNGQPQLALLLRTLAGDASTNVLSTPSLVMLDNEEASIVVGQNVPFITGQYANTGGGTTPTNPFQTIQREDVGLTLKIKPQINEGNAVRLDIEQEVSSLASSSVGADLITNTRKIKTSVMVDDGQILVLGGLIEDGLRENEQKVPGLGDIPLLGWLFKYKRTTKVKTNLMAFIHPVILKDAATQTRYTGEKYNYMRKAQLLDRGEGSSLLADKEIPVMKEFAAIPPLPPRYQPQHGATSADEPPLKFN